MTHEPLAKAIEAARAAGQVILEGFGRAAQVSSKSSPIDLVTETDRRAEATIVSRLAEAFPSHAFLGEESGPRGEGPLTWIIDPLDGTRNFTRTVPHFAVSIALVDGRDPVVGVVHDPVRGETFSAVKGQGARLSSPHLGERALVVSTPKQLDEALVATGFAYHRSEGARSNVEKACLVLRTLGEFRRAGSAALDLAYVAAGRLDGFWELNLQPWDTAAGALLVTEAGGVVSEVAGEPWDPFSATVLAGSPTVCEGLVRLFAGR